MPYRVIVAGDNEIITIFNVIAVFSSLLFHVIYSEIEVFR
jgi:hypothetical protein